MLVFGRRRHAVPLTALALLASVPAAAGTTPSAPSAQQTRPAVSPAHGGPHATFTLRLNVREALGIHGVVQSDYRVRVSRKDGSCVSQLVIANAAAGTRVRRTLSPPSGSGWCRGVFSGTVLLDSGPYCPKNGAQPRPCPLFASRQLAVGRFHFRVR